VNNVEFATVRRHVLQRIGLNKVKRVSRLMLIIHADHLKPGSMVAHRSSPGPAK
jgi:hypothetical protein